MLTDVGTKKQYWIGARLTDGNYQWITDENFQYSNWDYNQPDMESIDGENKEYVQLLNEPNPEFISNGSARFKWSTNVDDNINIEQKDFFDTHFVGFICEKETAVSVPENSYIVDMVNQYTSDQLYAQYNAILQSDDSHEVIFQKLTELFQKNGILDVREGIAYVSKASEKRRAYLTLTTDELFCAYNYADWLNNTAKGKVARGLLVADGLIFNFEINDWLDISTYLNLDYPGVTKYMDMLYDFMDEPELQMEILTCTSWVSKLAKNATGGIKMAVDSLIERINNCKNSEELTKLMRSSDAMNVYKKLDVTENDAGQYEFSLILDENSGMGKFLKASGYATKTISCIDLAINDIVDIIQLDSKLAVYESYRGFLEEISGSTDLPLEMRIAAVKILIQMDEGIFGEIRNIMNDVLSQTSAYKAINKEILTNMVGKTGQGTLGQYLALINTEAYFINAIVDVGSLTKGIAYVEGYAYLESHYKELLEESKSRFLSEQTEKNAWDFYEKYNLLYNLRCKGEEAYLRMSKLKGLAGYFIPNGYSLKKEVVEDTIQLLDTKCRFTLDEDIEVPESLQYLHKAVISCPVDVNVYAPDGTLIATLKDGVESDISNEHGRFAVIYRPYTGEYAKVICLAHEGNYVFDLIGVDTGLVSFEMASKQNEKVEVRSFDNVAINQKTVIEISTDQVEQQGQYSVDMDGDGKFESVENITQNSGESYRPVEKITLAEKSIKMKVGDRKTIGVDVSPSNASIKNVIWLSENEAIADVKEGRISALSEGTTQVYCISQDNVELMAVCNVTVEDGQVVEPPEESEDDKPNNPGLDDKPSSGSGGSGSSGGGSSSGGGGGAVGPAAAVGGPSSLPSYVVKGTWTAAADGNWTFTDEKGVLYRNMWAAVYNPYANTTLGQSSFDWFYFDAEGHMKTGWLEENGHKYYLNHVSDGTRGKMLIGWNQIDGKWYYFNDVSDGTRGALYVDKWIGEYYVGPDGVWKE